VYALGVLLWRIFHPRTDHGLGATAMQVGLNVLRGRRPPIDAQAAPAAVCALTAECWAHDPAARPSMADVAGRLHAACAAHTAHSAGRPANRDFWALLQAPGLADQCAALRWTRTGQLFTADAAVAPASPLHQFVVTAMRLSAPLDAALGGPMRVTRVVPVQHDLASTFLQLHASDGSSRAANPVLRPPNPTDPDSVAALTALKACFADAHGGMSRVTLAWHGTAAARLETVASDGPPSLRKTDAGFFGAGSYLALEAAYAARYAKMSPPNAAGECGVILYAVSLSRAVPVTLGRHYKPPGSEASPYFAGFSDFYSGNAALAPALSPNCDAHFVPVRHCGRRHPKDLAVALPHDVDYQACPEGAAEAHELVLLSHLRCTPVAIVYFQ
jgi:hypothetical protein